jgi:hypothetical protein
MSGWIEHHLGRWPLFLALAVVALASGCGATGQTSGPAHGGQTNPAANTAPPQTARRNPLTTSAIPPGQHLRGDGDADNPGDIDGNGDIDPEDGDSDYPVPNSYRLPDEDDKATYAYGHRPTAALAHTIESVVKRYFNAALVSDGAIACSLLPAGLASSAAGDYGQSSGSASQHGAGACGAAISMLFQRSHNQLSEAITVLEVRLDGSNAQVILSSKKMPAGEVHLARQGSSWKMLQLMALPLP